LKSFVPTRAGGIGGPPMVEARGDSSVQRRESALRISG
jgi:hypothetical protein